MYTPEGYIYWEDYEYKKPQGSHIWKIKLSNHNNLIAKCNICNLELIGSFIGHSAETFLYAWAHSYNNFEYPLSCEEFKMNSALE